MSTSKAIIIAALILSASLVVIAVVQIYANPYNTCKREIREVFADDPLSVNRICAGSG